MRGSARSGAFVDAEASAAVLFGASGDVGAPEVPGEAKEAREVHMGSSRGH